MWEFCVKCGKVICDDEWVINWGTCAECLDASFEAYLERKHLLMQRKIEED